MFERLDSDWRIRKNPEGWDGKKFWWWQLKYIFLFSPLIIGGRWKLIFDLRIFFQMGWNDQNHQRKIPAKWSATFVTTIQSTKKDSGATKVAFRAWERHL